MNARNVEALLRVSLACTDIDHASSDCLVDELIRVAERWQHPADALFPFEDGNLRERDLERVLFRCSGAAEG